MTNIVTIGGGTWTYNLLSALKNLDDVDVSAIVTMSDDGWSTGKIRDEYWSLPPWDLRRAIVALSDDEKTQILRQIFNHRFQYWTFEGHNLGNIIMTALEQMTDNFGQAVNMLEELFDIKGRVYPATFEKTRLIAKLENLDYIIWETNIDIPKHDPNLRIQELHIIKEEYVSAIEKLSYEKWISHHIIESVYEKFFEDKPAENPYIPDVIEKADYIIFSPGDLFTSLLPNILVWNIAYNIKNSKAKKILFWNLFTKYWETTWFQLSDFLDEFSKYLGKDVFDKILVQDWDNHSLDDEILEKYSKENKTLIKNDIQDYRIISRDFIKQSDLIRHDAEKMKQVIMEIVRWEV